MKNKYILLLISLMILLIRCEDEKKQMNNHMFLTEESFNSFLNKNNIEKDSSAWLKIDLTSIRKAFQSDSIVNLEDHISPIPKLNKVYAVDQLKITFNKNMTKLNSVDSITVIPKYSLSNNLDVCYFGDVDSILSDIEYRKTHKVVSRRITKKLVTDSIGTHYLKGVYESILLDGTRKLTPFEHKYKVESK